MGKKDFDSKIRSRFGGEEFTCKVSYYSDTYDPNARYAGIIIYHLDNELHWKTSKGHNARGCYFIIQNTERWQSEEANDRAGKGMAHDFLYNFVTDVDFSRGPNTLCCGGFTVDKGTTKYSSVWLNETSNKDCEFPWESDNDRNLCASERAIVDRVITEWKKRGKHIVVTITQPPLADNKPCGSLKQHLPVQDDRHTSRSSTIESIDSKRRFQSHPRGG